MPEKPEVVTVVKVLQKHIVGKTITDCKVYWDRMIETPSVNNFIEQIKNQTIESIHSRGKWIVITLTKNVLLIHLRMEGKFFFRETTVPRNKHEHVVFTLDQKEEMRFSDVRKFGKMLLLDKTTYTKQEPLLSLGYEYDDPRLTTDYLKERFASRKVPIKTALLDQSIIAGIGNIYDDEILFLSKISPLKEAKQLSKKDCQSIIDNTKLVLEKAIALGGTTIRSYTSEEGVHGRFQNSLLVHGKENASCPVCKSTIIKIKVGGRGTYYCPTCQKLHLRK